MRILIVEDQADIRDVLYETLTDAGHAVSLAGTFGEGRVAIEAAGNGGFTWDLLLTDLVLPGGSGLDLARLARSLGVPVLLCSGHPGQMAALDESGIPFLRKPFTLQDMLDQIAAATAPPAPDSERGAVEPSNSAEPG